MTDIKKRISEMLEDLAKRPLISPIGPQHGSGLNQGYKWALEDVLKELED